MKFRLIVLFLITTMMVHYVNAQQKTDSLAMKLVERHKLLSAAKMSRPGFRVQLYFGNDRSKALEMRSDFMTSYPSYGAYLIYQQPYFKVRAGDFYTRLEAQGFLKKIQSIYSSAFIVTDEVKLPGKEGVNDSK